MMRRRWRRRRDGFTLVELVMVVVIIGILAALAVPRYVQLHVQARSASAKAELDALRVASTTYFASTIAQGTAIYPPDKAALMTMLREPLGTLDPVNTSFQWSYDSSTGRVVQSGDWPD